MENVTHKGLPLEAPAPIDMILFCPACGMQHIDMVGRHAPSWHVGDRALTPYGVGTISRTSAGVGFFECYFSDLELPSGRCCVDAKDMQWPNEPHRSHLCRKEDGGCGYIWRPADVPTNGVIAVKSKGRLDSPLRDSVASRWLDRDALASRNAELEREVERLRQLINTPQTHDWMRAVELEAAHQQERWGSAHDAGKAPEDWFWLLGYLSGKALAALKGGDDEKTRHHIISSAAVLRNWHRHIEGELTSMRPGIDPVARGIENSEQTSGWKPCRDCASPEYCSNGLHGCDLEEIAR